MTQDRHSDLLAEFVEVFGWPGEDPRQLITPYGTAPEARLRDASILSEDIAVLEDLLRDQRRREMAVSCRELVAEILDLGTDVRLLHELEAQLGNLHFDLSRLVLGLELFAQAGRADPRSKGWKPIAKTAVSRGGMSPLYARAREMVSSLILRLYVAMVYLRGDAMMEALGRLDATSAPRLERIRQLFSQELVRHLRNAIAHGHVAPHAGGLRIYDRSFVFVVTPGLANELANIMFLFYFQAVMVMTRGDRSGR